jgi:hypothetical protein
LIRSALDAIHARCRERSIHVQAIVGLHGFYRQFGYEYALERATRRVVSVARLRGADPAPPLTARDATVDDLAFVEEAYRASVRGNAVTCRLTPERWRLEAGGRTGWRDTFRILERGPRRIGFAAVSADAFAASWPGPSTLRIRALGIDPGARWFDEAAPILRAVAETPADGLPDEPRPSELSLEVGGHHPIDDVLPEVRAGRRPGEYAWYLRVDLVPFVRTIAPALEARLEASPGAGSSGPLTLSFYRSGIRILLERGRIVDVASVDRPVTYDNATMYEEEDDATFPDLVFSQILLGFRSLVELEGAYPDVRVRTDRARKLLDAMFPKRPSSTWTAV